MDIEEQNYFMVQKAIKLMLDKLTEPEFYKIRQWNFVE